MNTHNANTGNWAYDLERILIGGYRPDVHGTFFQYLIGMALWRILTRGNYLTPQDREPRDHRR